MSKTSTFRAPSLTQNNTGKLGRLNKIQVVVVVVMVVFQKFQEISAGNYSKFLEIYFNLSGYFWKVLRKLLTKTYE